MQSTALKKITEILLLTRHACPVCPHGVARSSLGEISGYLIFSVITKIWRRTWFWSQYNQSNRQFNKYLFLQDCSV